MDATSRTGHKSPFSMMKTLNKKLNNRKAGKQGLSVNRWIGSLLRPIFRTGIPGLMPRVQMKD